MNNQNFQLNIGDEIGFVKLATDVDQNDQVIFFPVAEIIEVGGETAYRYQYPDGEVSRGYVRASELSSRFVKINPARSLPETIEDRMICLTERKTEFVEALNRGGKSNFEVYADFDRDAFVVVNRDKGNEYRVRLETRADGKLYGECECADFEYRKRICKHVGEVLTNALLSVGV